MYYASVGFLAIIIHIVININAMKKPEANKDMELWERYREFLLALMLFYFADVVWGSAYDTGIILLAYADTVLFFVSMGFSLLLWMRFIVAFLDRTTLFGRVLTTAGWGIFSFELMMLIVNLFVPLFFQFTPQGEYIPGQARYITLYTQVVIFGLVALYTIYRAVAAQGQEKLHLVAVGVSGLVMAVFIVLQALYPMLPLYTVGCLIATCIIHTYVELDHELELGSVRRIAYKDSLTNVKNVNAYTEARDVYDERIRSGSVKELGIIVFDLNNLKKVNDTLGHEAGDRYLKEAAKMICNAMKHSPVFRIGGDEFVTVLEGEDYENREFLLNLFEEQVNRNVREGGVVISSGMDIFDPKTDTGIEEIFERADSRMYDRKKELKSGKIEKTS